jgi:hypothetical protein
MSGNAVESKIYGNQVKETLLQGYLFLWQQCIFLHNYNVLYESPADQILQFSKSQLKGIWNFNCIIYEEFMLDIIVPASIFAHGNETVVPATVTFHTVPLLSILSVQNTCLLPECTQKYIKISQVSLLVHLLKFWNTLTIGDCYSMSYLFKM